jgi:hypothetical protein
MSDPVEPLVLDLLEWLRREPRLYSEVMEAWRTSCPRLPVWEEANSRGFVEHRHAAGSEAFVTVSPAGLAYIETHRAALRALPPHPGTVVGVTPRRDDQGGQRR